MSAAMSSAGEDLIVSTSSGSVGGGHGGHGGHGHGMPVTVVGGLAISGVCWFECGQPATQNLGSPRYPKFVCGPCRAATRAMQSQINAANSPEVKKSYHSMVKSNAGQWKNMIRAARIATASDMPGVSTLAARDAQLSLYKQRILTEVPQYRASQHQ